ncbi:MAG: hypothetical protein H7144_08465 [Burkholderiales bacterium]|nr:hypothetical protein [Phycisphaerae bacterium]
MLRTFGLLLLLLSSVASAESPKVPLGPRITGNHDITFQPFAEGEKLDRMTDTEVMRLFRKDKQWTLIFEKAQLPEPTPIADGRDPQGREQAGYLAAAVTLIRSADPSADVLRSDLLDTGALRIGLIIASIKSGERERALLQRALVEVTPRLYYSIEMRSPAPLTGLDEDPSAREAAETFRAIVDSIQRVDLSKVREDQDQRLFRTRALFVEWNAKRIQSVLIPEAYLRIRRDGKDVGYIYVAEEAATLPRPVIEKKAIEVAAEKAAGVRVSMRMRTMPEQGKMIDTQSWMFVTTDRRHEVWSATTLAKDANAKNESEKEVHLTELGASDMKQERVFDRDMKPGDFKDADKQGSQPFRMVDEYKLVVNTESGTGVAPPVERDLPPFYLPQALAWTLPRLLPLNRPTGYLFASYSPDMRQVMLRYVDVGLEGDTSIGGIKARAVPITERLGDDGSPTVHYVTMSGQYLGTMNQQTGLVITPTDRASLLKIWKDANLTQPVPAAARLGPAPVGPAAEPMGPPAMGR